MTQPDILQAVGTGAILGLGLFGFRVGSNGTGRFWRYGRETLLCISAWMLSVVVLRSLDLANVLTPTDARVINGTTALVFFAIEVQVVWLHRLDALLNGKRR